MIVDFLRTHRHLYSIERMCRVLNEHKYAISPAVRRGFLVPVFREPGTAVFRVVGTGPGRRSRPGCLLYSSGSIGAVALRMSKSPMRIRCPLLRRLTRESAPILSGSASIQ